ncbi:MAG: hypothetical protein RBT59_11860, partial [Arcobacteraceae bacterium]|nr:hypothetical protein [Arcobacteraceae bacterium]
NITEISDSAITTPTETSSLLNDTYSAILHVVNTEISGLKIGVWIILLLVSVAIAWIIYKIINKKNEHHDKEMYEKAKNYLHKAGDLNRRLLPFALLATLLFLLFIEASGFSYVFSSLMIDKASAQILHNAMIFGGFVISIILMFLTHFTGEELHKMSVLKAINNEMSSIPSEILLKDKNDFPRNKISLENSLDDDKAKTVVIPQYNRMEQKFFDWKKVKTSRGYYKTSITFLLIATIGIGAMFVRFYVFDKNNEGSQKSIMQDTKSFDVETALFKEVGENNKKLNETNAENSLPSYFKEQSELRDKYKRSSTVEAQKKASYVTYIVMMMVFFGIQAVGIIIGSKYNFVGVESKKAYKIIESYKKAK